MTKNIIYILVSILILGTSCDDFLDREPLDEVTPAVYFKHEDDLAAYTINAYGFRNHASASGLGGIITADLHTDDMACTDPSYSYWAKGQWKVPDQDNSYGFWGLRNANYFLEQVLPKWEAKEIQGNETNIKHYIGEMYVIRAWINFANLRRYGDFPIVRRPLPDDKEALAEASRRKPRNEFARFIVQDLDSAAMLLQDDFKKNRRLTKKAALLLKSRVALYEGTWLTYHKNTAHVPGGPGWPGATVDYNKDFSIDIDAEINYFLAEAMKAAEDVANAADLTPNSGVIDVVSSHDGWNQYFDMFSATDMSRFSEVILWREFSMDLSIAHAVGTYIRLGGDNGITKGAVNSFLMTSGLPIYSPQSNYKGDKSIYDLKQGRDTRLQLFIFDEKMKLNLDGDYSKPETQLFGYRHPGLLQLKSSRDVTGYRNRKFYNYDPDHTAGNAGTSYYGSVIFRAAEAYLNYIEACYVKNNSLDANAQRYWKALRRRAGIDEDINKTIAATDLSKEDDWAVYSAGRQISPTLYNIRRERRNELMAEGFRWDDLKRWRALDQVKNYIVEGFNLWDEAYMADKYQEEVKDDNGNPTGEKKNLLIEQGNADNKIANVSSRQNSKYLRPYQIIKNQNLVFEGYTWSKANYLAPLPPYEIRLTATNPDDTSTSPIYQNPYWTTQAGSSALE